MQKNYIAPYVNLIERFLDGSIDASTFERAYLDMFKHEEVFFGEELFPILQRVFSDVDAFCADPALRMQCIDVISEEQLREGCADAFRQLKKYLDSGADNGVES